MAVVWVAGASARKSIMKRYWSTFAKQPVSHPINLGCGVSAASVDDAINVIRASFPDLTGGHHLSMIEDVDVSALDARHVIPNIGNVFERGVWWPRTK